MVANGAVLREIRSVLRVTVEKKNKKIKKSDTFVNGE